ncbi:MAG: PilZ domain-containing protein [Proteobacteria bacterium]|nr:PilZ domain-containing protein [Pseudomonadota bacterium]
MNKLERTSEDKRSWDRFKFVLKGKYSHEQRSRQRECTVLDMSVNGVCLKLPRDDDFAAGAPIFIEVLNREMNKINIEARVVWSQHTDESVLVGSRFTETLDTETFETLE